MSMHAALMQLGRLRMEESAVTEAAVARIHEQAWAELASGSADCQAMARPRARPARAIQPGRRASAPGRRWSSRGLQRRLTAGGCAGSSTGWTHPPPLRAGVEPPGASDLHPVTRAPIGRKVADHRLQDGRPDPCQPAPARPPAGALRARREACWAPPRSWSRRSPTLEGFESHPGAGGRRPAGPKRKELAARLRAGVVAGRFDARPERRRCSLCAYRLACPAAL